MASGLPALIAAVLFEVAGTTALRYSDGFRHLVPSIVVLAGYGASFYFLSIALRTIPVGIAYAIWAGLGIAIISLIGALFLRERLDATAVAGVCLIAIGAILIYMYSKAERV